jgi:hypothetical protein
MAVTPLRSTDDRTPAPKPAPGLTLVPNTHPVPPTNLPAAPDPDADSTNPAAESLAQAPKPTAPTETSHASTHSDAPGQPTATSNALTRSGEPGESDGMLEAVTRPRLLAVRDGDEHYVPATTRYADNLTDHALALRLKAITRLGVASTPRSTTSEPLTTPTDTTAPADNAGTTTVPVTTDGSTTAPTTTDTATTDVGTAGDAGTTAGGAVGGGATVPVVTGARTAARGMAAAGSSARAAVNGGAARVGEVARRGVVRGDLPGLPDARLWGGRLAQAVSEVLAGDRPISQLVRFTDDQVFLELNRRVRLLGLNSTAGSRGAEEKSTVRSVRVFMPEPSIAEVAAHVRHGERSRAVALRLEIRRNRWICTALELG